jgi:integration host factor subunit alpha
MSLASIKKCGHFLLMTMEDNVLQERQLSSDNSVVIARASVGERATLTRAELADALYRNIGLSRLESAQLLEMVLAEIGDAFARGENVKLSGFGTFNLRSKRERIGRNPKTGVEAKIEQRNVLIFRPSDNLRQRINADRAFSAAVR